MTDTFQNLTCRVYRSVWLVAFINPLQSQISSSFLSFSPSPPLFGISLFSFFLSFLLSFLSLSLRHVFFLWARGWNAWCNAACLGLSSSFNENVSIWLESCQELLRPGSNDWGWSERSGEGGVCVCVCVHACVVGVRVSCHIEPYRRNQRTGRMLHKDIENNLL